MLNGLHPASPCNRAWRCGCAPRLHATPLSLALPAAPARPAVKLWDGVKGTFVATFRGHVGPVYQVAWSADSRLFASGSKDSTLKVGGGGGGGGLRGMQRRLARLAGPWPPHAAALRTHHCCRPATSPTALIAQVWDLRSKKLLMDLPGHADEVFRWVVTHGGGDAWGW